MGFTYSEETLEDIIQPQSIRFCNRFRGPRESEKLNLEAQQFLLDVSRLRKELIDVESAQGINSGLFYGDDVTLLSTSQIGWDTDSSLTDTDVVYENVNVLAKRLEELTNKIRRLEKHQIIQRPDLYPGESLYPGGGVYP